MEWSVTLDNITQQGHEVHSILWCFLQKVRCINHPRVFIGTVAVMVLKNIYIYRQTMCISIYFLSGVIVSVSFCATGFQYSSSVLRCSTVTQEWKAMYREGAKYSSRATEAKALTKPGTCVFPDLNKQESSVVLQQVDPAHTAAPLFPHIHLCLRLLFTFQLKQYLATVGQHNGLLSD